MPSARRALGPKSPAALAEAPAADGPAGYEMVGEQQSSEAGAAAGPGEPQQGAEERQ